jgi:uncharacterized protein with von Willebrand factor type A (vWA) domain
MTFSRPDNQSRAPIKFGVAAALLHDQHRQQHFDEAFAPVFRLGRPAVLTAFCQKS